MGSIELYKTAAGTRYRVRYRKPDHSQGAKRGFTTKKEATLYLASVEISKNRGAYIDPSRSRVTVAEWMATWAATRTDLRTSTRDRMNGIIRRNIVPALGNVPLGDLQRLQVQQWASALSKTQGAWSVRKIVNTLSGALKLAVEDERIVKNPALGLKLPKITKTQKRYLTHEQVRSLAAAVGERAPEYETLVFVLAYCGLRWGEVSGLQVGDVDLRRARLEIRHTIVETNGILEHGGVKTYEERSVPVPAGLLAMLKESVEGRAATELVFVGRQGGGVLRNRIFRRGFLTAAAIEAGVEGLTPHELRHTCASLAVSAGANVKALQKMLGHSSAKETLDTYADLFDDDLDTVAIALDHYFVQTNVSKMRPDDEILSNEPAPALL